LCHTCVQGHIFVLDLDFWLGSYMCKRSHFCTWFWFLVRVIHVYMVICLYLTLIFGLGHACVQSHIFVLDLDFWLGSYMCTRSHLTMYTSMTLTKNQNQVQKCDLLHMYDPNQKSRSSTKIWPCTHVWPKPKMKVKNKNVTLYTCMTQAKNQGQVQKYDLVHMYDPNQKSRSRTKMWPCTHVWP
jgi:hypothetical protein